MFLFKKNTYDFQLIGVIEQQDRIVRPSVFGQEIHDCNISKQLTSLLSPEVHCFTMLNESQNPILATAMCVLSDLVLGQNSNEYCASLQAISRVGLQKENENSYLVDVEHMFTPKNEAPFTSSMLCENNTCLSITVKVTAPLKPLLSKVGFSIFNNKETI